MMCIACEQDAMWFAYLERKGLITPDDYLMEQQPSAFASEPSVAAGVKEETPVEPADKTTFSGDDPAI
ncbi:MAG: hypothetical protein ABSB37_03940 [Xanthobacteraceae bacterium]|jgi:hypothetical protein